MGGLCRRESTQQTATPGGFTPAQMSTILHLLSQTLHQNPPAPMPHSLNTASQSSISSPPLIPISASSSAPPIFSTAQLNPVVTLPTTLTTSVTHIPPIHSQETNEDALSTASDVPPPATIRPPQRTDSSQSLLLPPAPTSVQQQIIRGEFIDFNTLLPEVMFSTANVTPSSGTTRSTSQTPRINSFSSWLDAWNIYIAIVVAHNPSRALELLGYQRLIHSASKHFNTSAWLNYDVQFRTLAAANPQLQWNLRHSELWLDNMASHTGSSLPNTRWPCTYCGSMYHFPDRCPRCPFRTVQFNDGDTFQRDNGPRLSTCRDFNNSTCHRNPCRYQHRCQYCGSSSHPAYRCGRPPTSR